MYEPNIIMHRTDEVSEIFQGNSGKIQLYAILVEYGDAIFLFDDPTPNQGGVWENKTILVQWRPHESLSIHNRWINLEDANGAVSFTQDGFITLEPFSFVDYRLAAVEVDESGPVPITTPITGFEVVKSVIYDTNKPKR